jgi:hypothetical protein
MIDHVVPPRAGVRDPMFDFPTTTPRVVVEVGSYKGAWAYRALKQFPESKVFCVDPWEETGVDGSSANDEIFSTWIQHHINQIGRRIWPLRMKSVEAAAAIKSTLGTSSWRNRFVDFLFIDGMHTEEAVYSDLTSWCPLITPGGVVVLDNYEKPPVMSGVDRFQAENPRIRLHVGPANFKTLKRTPRIDCWFYVD